MHKKYDQKTLENLYESVVISEINQRYVDDVNEFLEDKKLSFDNIFGKSHRIVIDVKGVGLYNDLKKELSKTKNFAGIDFDKKELIKRFELDPKYGGGIKEQRINIGKAISSLKIDEDKKKKLLNWYANFSSNLSEIEDLQQYKIVLSRSPIDVLRMSDMGNITSCHSQGDSYFKCAVQEAKTGGPIAYLVNTNELEKELDNNKDGFENGEFFEDRERGVDGLVPLSRLRIRKYKNFETEEEIAVPEGRTYGTRKAGFYDTVKDFLKNSQQIDEKELYKEFKNKNLILTGGSYTDTSDSELFNKFFDSDEFYGSLRHEENEEDSGTIDRAEQLEEELEEFHLRYNDMFTHCVPYYQVDSDDDAPYFTYGANLQFNISEYETTELFDDSLRNLDKYEIDKYTGYNITDFSLQSEQIHAKFFKIFGELLADVSFDFIDNISYMSASDQYEGIIDFSIENARYDGIATNADDYLSFLEDIKAVDADYEKIKKCFLKACFRVGFIKNAENIEPNDLEKFEEFVETLKNLDYDQSQESFTMALNIAQNIPNNSLYQNVKSIDWDVKTVRSYGKYIDTYFKPTQNSDSSQMSFKQFFESRQYTENSEYDLDFSISIAGRFNQSENTADYPKFVTADLIMKPKIWNDAQIERIQFVNDSKKHFETIANYIFLRDNDILPNGSERVLTVYKNILIS